MMQSVQVIIERLKSHPEDFFGESDHRGRMPKFVDITEKIDDLLADKDKQYVHRLWYLEPEEKEALIAAYKEARRARFEAQVFHTLLTKPEEPTMSTVTYNTKDRYSLDGKSLMQGFGAAQIKGEGAKIVDQINKAFEEEYAKNRNT
jgi:predicted Zn-dependent protease